ncbi:MAG: serine/threonine-protein kinase [Planctomycetales bacterium]
MKFTFPPESRPLDGYTIKRAIHRGGFGEVYYALSDGGKEVALKLLQHETEIELRGIQQCLNLKHPNLLSIFDIRSDGDGDQWIVMEYVAGKGLADVVEEHPEGMPLEEVRRWLSGMANGLAFLHDRGIVHRDLKPANVHLDQGVVKIGDVGLSKFISQSRRNEQTQSVGTVYYMAPEVAHGRYGKEVDVYSLGIVLYEMLTGRVPFDGETTGEILMKHLTERPDLEPLPPRLRPVVARALAKDPAQRTPTVEELEREFQLAVRGVELPRDIPDESFVGKRSAVSDQRSAVEREDAPHEPRGSSPRLRTVSPGRGFFGRREVRIWIVLVVVLLLWSATAPSIAGTHAAQSLLRMAFLVAIGYGAWRGVQRLGSASSVPSQESWVGHPHQAAPEPRPSLLVGTAHPTRLPAVPPLHRSASRLTPETPRAISWRQRLAELSGSMTLAVPYAALVTAAIALIAPPVFSTSLEESFRAAAAAAEHWAGRTKWMGDQSFGLSAIDPGTVGLFALVTLLGSWGLLFAAKLREGKPVDGVARRLGQFAVGLLVGAAAFGIGHALLAAPGGSLDGVFDSVGVHPLAGTAPAVAGKTPTLAGYMIFFGGLFGLRGWWRQADAFRRRRFRIGSLLLTVLVGFFLPVVFAFPQTWGTLWAAAISGVVQLSAPWVPEADRGRSAMI